jgi:two-component sensor histidine kinase
MKKSINKIISSRYQALISVLVIGTLINILLPSYFTKYNLSIEDNQPIYFNNHLIYEDLNQDGLSEKITVSSVSSEYSYINLYDEYESLKTVWNLKGAIKNNSLCFTDINKNGFKEINFITLKKDSLLFHSFETDTTNTPKKWTTFLATVPNRFNNYDFDISNFITVDMNNDKYDELVFSVYGRYSLQPRSIISCDLKNQIISKSVAIGSYLTDLKAVKVPEDGRVYITGNSTVTNYYHDTALIAYKDNKAWLMVLNEDLKFVFPPRPFEIRGSMLQVYPLIKNNTVTFAALISKKLQPKSNHLFIFNDQGLITNEYKDPKKQLFTNIFKSKNIASNQFYLLKGQEEAVLLNDKLKTSDHIKINNSTHSKFFTINLDSDSDEEIVSWNAAKSQLVLYQPRFSFPVKIKLKEIKNQRISIYQNHSRKGHYLSVKGTDHWYLLSYTRNKLFLLKYLIYGLVYALLFLVVFIVQKNQTIRQLTRDQSLIRLKLQSIKNQIDPHFTLNTLNTIGTSILKDEKERSYENLQRFSRLIRATLQDAESIVRSLKDELQFIEDYLNIMKMRYVDRFEYVIEIEDEVNLERTIPKMMVQSFVENALKHGILPSSKKGLVIINLRKSESCLEIMVKDNGIGRQKAKEIHDSGTGKGMSIMQEYANIFNAFNKEKFHFRTLDLFENQEPSGTQIIIYIPDNYEFTIS